MERRLLTALLLVLLASSTASAQEWATKMFTVTSHDFGTVAKGSKAEYHFQFTNQYMEKVHVSSVSTSCQCTTPIIATPGEIGTWQTGEIIARFNTPSFSGHHAATVTVTFDKPFFAQVQLNVWGDIRTDITVQPGEVGLGTVDQGQGAERRLVVTRFGRSDWRITDVRSVNTNYEVEVGDPRVNGDQVNYDLVVRLKKDAPPGYLHDQLILVTNDGAASQFPIDVEGTVTAELNVNPQVLTFGAVDAGHSIQKPLVINSSRKAFRIAGVHCSDNDFSFKVASDRASKVQIINVTFNAPAAPGKVTQKIHIDTDMGQGLGLDIVAQATVNASAPIAGSADLKSTAGQTPPAATHGRATNVLHSSSGASGGDKLDSSPIKLDGPSNSSAGNNLRIGAPADSPTPGAASTPTTGRANSDDASDEPTSVAPSGAAKSGGVAVPPNPIRAKSGDNKTAG